MTDPQATTQRRQALLIGHGASVTIFGLVSGFFLLFNVLGEVKLWPFPGLALEVAGTPQAWRAAHVGPILNGVLCMAGAFALPLLRLPDSSERWVTWGLIYTVWGNAAFYFFSIFGTNRGLAGSSERFGAGNIFDILAYVPAATATLVTIFACFLIARGAFTRAREGA